MLDAVRLGPADDATVVTAAQLREVVDRLSAVGHWHPGDPTIWIVLDSGYDVTRLAFLLADLPVMLIGRLRSDRVLARPVEPRRPDVRGRPRRHGPVLVLADPITWPAPEHTSSTDTTRYGTAQASAWHRCHPRLEHRGPWRDHHGELPIIEGTLIITGVGTRTGHAGYLPCPLMGLPSMTGPLRERFARLSCED